MNIHLFVFHDNFPWSLSVAVAGAGLFPCGTSGSKHMETTVGETLPFSKFMGNAIYFMIKLHQGNAAFCIRQFSSSNCYPGGLFFSLYTQPIYNTNGSNV